MIYRQKLTSASAEKHGGHENRENNFQDGLHRVDWGRETSFGVYREVYREHRGAESQDLEARGAAGSCGNAALRLSTAAVLGGLLGHGREVKVDDCHGDVVCAGLPRQPGLVRDGSERGHRSSGVGTASDDIHGALGPHKFKDAVRSDD